MCRSAPHILAKSPLGGSGQTATPALEREGAKGLAWKCPSHREPGPDSQEGRQGGGGALPVTERRTAKHRPGRSWAQGRLTARTLSHPSALQWPWAVGRRDPQNLSGWQGVAPWASTHQYMKSGEPYFEEMEFV